MDSLDLVGIGNPSLDILFTPDPAPDHIKRLFGGIAVNTVVGLARMDMKTGLIGYIGREDHARRIKEELTGYGIDISHLRQTDFTHLVTVDVTPSRSVIKSSGLYWPVTKLTDDDLSYLSSSRSAFSRVDSRVFGTCAETMSGHDKIMFASLSNVRQTPSKAKKIASSRIAAIFGTETEIERFRDAIDEAAKKGTIVAVTRGYSGCEIHYKGSSQIYSPFDVRTIDPTGSGDAFAAGFIYGYLKGWDINMTSYFANACGALASTEYGARSRVIKKQDAFSLMEGNGIKIPDSIR